MKILIIGGTRFMGPHVARRLSAEGYDVTVFHRGTTIAGFPNSVGEILGDRNNLRDFLKEFEKLKPDVILDMILLTESQAKELVEVMSGIAGRLVVASSCDVYRNYNMLRGEELDSNPVERLTEDSPLRAKLYPYRKDVPDENNILHNYDKILVERAVMSDPNLPATVLRLPMVYGPGDYQHRFYGYIKRMIDNRPAILIDENQAKWRITRGYVENCAEAIYLAIMNEKAAGRIYNVGEPQALPEKEWIEKLAEIMGWGGKIIYTPKDKLPDHLKGDEYWQYHLDVDTSRIRKDLGFIEKIDREEALRQTIEWERNNPPAKGIDDSEYKAEDEACGGFIC
ncbi:MAG: NAD-dependent epimerase/dehydratase family protein [Candidatus Zixiibacteriota bacterium]|nr:MAG: NAD-dependent epimerase/dehydratase family protein [candidate division Zixibacteria bacterium]